MPGRAKIIPKTVRLWLFVWIVESALSLFAPKVPAHLGEEVKSFVPPTRQHLTSCRADGYTRQNGQVML